MSRPKLEPCPFCGGSTGWWGNVPELVDYYEEIFREALGTAGVAAPQAPSFDVEVMLRECVPAGSFFGSLKVADAIRAYFAARGVKEADRAQK